MTAAPPDSGPTGVGEPDPAAARAAVLPLKLAFEANLGDPEPPLRWSVRNAEGWPIGSAWVIHDESGVIVQVGDRLTRGADVADALAGMNAWIGAVLDAEATAPGGEVSGRPSGAPRSAEIGVQVVPEGSGGVSGPLSVAGGDA